VVKIQRAATPEAQTETTSTVLMKAVVMQSDALTFIPRELIWWEVQARQLVPLHVQGTDWTRIVGITRRRRGSVSPAALRLLEALRNVARRQFEGVVG
jgi:DNA-binding transcriptional LysR family regulator